METAGKPRLGTIHPKRPTRLNHDAWMRAPPSTAMSVNVESALLIKPTLMNTTLHVFALQPYGTPQSIAFVDRFKVPSKPQTPNPKP